MDTEALRISSESEFEFSPPKEPATAGSRWISDLHWVRTGPQSRSQRTQESLLAAAAELFGEKGMEATSVADVAARAGCSVGSVYHHFRDKKALLYAVFERMSEELHATSRDAADPARWDGAGVADILRGYLELWLEIGRERPTFKLVGLEVARTDPALPGHLTGLRLELDQALTQLRLARRDAIGHADPALAIALVLDPLGAVLRARLDETQGPTQLTNRPDAVFVREALASACAYPRLPAPHDG